MAQRSTNGTAMWLVAVRGDEAWVEWAGAVLRVVVRG